MNEYPILFQTEMVRAILGGTKTQTRRVMKPQPARGAMYSGFIEREHRMQAHAQFMYDGQMHFVSPYGQPGDLLWVRETWTYRGREVVYRADDKYRDLKWRPSIHMPKKHARLWLKIVNVHCEYLRSITNENAITEGCEDTDLGEDLIGPPYAYARTRFAVPWDANNAKSGYPWHSNPWVWVIEFEKVKP